MTDSIHVISISCLLIFLGGAIFHRLTSKKTPEGARSLLRPSGRLALMGILLTGAFATTVPAIYEFIELFVPITNGTSIFAQILATTAIALLGAHLALAYKADAALRWILGIRGALALTITTFVGFFTLILSDTPEPSPRLVDYMDQPAVQLGHWAGLAYTAYIMSPLVLLIFKDSHTNPLRITRVGARLISIGFAMSIARAISYPLELQVGLQAFYLFELVSQVSTACVVLGLWFFAYTRTSQKARQELKVSLSID